MMSCSLDRSHQNPETDNPSITGVDVSRTESESNVQTTASAITLSKGESSGRQLNTPTAFAGGEQLVGSWSKTRAGQAQFKGIPFAAPPTNEGRFRPPATHVPRTGLQVATKFGPACVQEQGNANWYRMVAAGVGADDVTIPALENMAEDCLYLNIWTENLDSDKKAPVLVWIYGGSNRNGFSHEPNYHGHNVAAKGVVFVSLNYRVGALGFMSHPALSAESSHQSSGNYGLLDQIAALQWVQENIAAFGGDPEAVTVSGESAGAGNSANLIATPLAKGLFKRAILQSGGMRMSYRPNLHDNEESGALLAQGLGIDSQKDAASHLRKIPALEIMKKQRELITAYNDVVEDGWVLPKSARSILDSGEYNPVDLLIGSNAQEWLMYYPASSGVLEYEQALESYGGSHVTAFRQLLDATNMSPLEKRDFMSSGHSFHCVATKLAGRIDQHGGKAFVYRFSRVRPNAGALMAYHGAEIPYAFDTADDWLPANEQDRLLTDSMLNYWTNFVKTGDPNSADLPVWPAYTQKQRRYQDLGAIIQSGGDLNREFCALMNRVWDEKLATKTSG